MAMGSQGKHAQRSATCFTSTQHTRVPKTRRQWLLISTYCMLEHKAHCSKRRAKLSRDDHALTSVETLGISEAKSPLRSLLWSRGVCTGLGRNKLCSYHCESAY